MQPLTNFALETLQDRYFLDGEDWSGLINRVSSAYSSDENHKKRIAYYIHRLWFMPATPILSNAGTDRGLPISCYLNNVADSFKSIAGKLNENNYISFSGGGIGTNWSEVRELGAKIGKYRGVSSGIIPFLKVMDAGVSAISQGSLRRGSGAAYLDINHPEIEEFINLRDFKGNFNRICPNLHHGVIIDDDFMHKVLAGSTHDLISPHTKEVIKTVDARELFQKILEIRLKTGEPYILFIDTVNKHLPHHHRKLGLKVKQSNLCSEITLPTGKDYNGKDRTAVCCLSSVNLEYYDDWKDHKSFLGDIYRFLDNILTDFIDKTEHIDHLKDARYSAIMERSIGLGVMGYHYYLQKNGIPFGESAQINENIFSNLAFESKKINSWLGRELGSNQDCLDCDQAGIRRFSNMTAIAPTVSISTICGTSPSIEPVNANIYTQKTLSGSFEVKNKYLENLLQSKGCNDDVTWDSIIENRGSVSHLGCLTDHEKEVFKTAWEIDPMDIVDLAGARARYIDQSQSINLFLNPDIDKKDLLNIHIQAWKKGVKSLYYCRSKSLQRPEFMKGVEGDNSKDIKNISCSIKDTDCLACQ